MKTIQLQFREFILTFAEIVCIPSCSVIVQQLLKPIKKQYETWICISGKIMGLQNNKHREENADFFSIKNIEKEDIWKETKPYTRLH